MVRRLTEQLNVIESDEAVSEMFGEMKATLENAGTTIDDADLYIAACSMVHGLHSQKVFSPSIDGRGSGGG